uniref:Fusion protein n=1 Tax=Lymantria dispar multicapsid nuclear polyhedrosis virus TaxID=10449 RepID=A0A1B1MQZ0_NPVLD|nr:fusion protein [Lymantria dispar multiple nucleopolyhedrovirus]
MALARSVVRMLLLFAVAANGSQPPRITDMIEVVPLPHTSGFYYQPINRMQFVEDVWHFLIEVDHSVIFQELDELYRDTILLLNNTRSPRFVSANCSTNAIIESEIDTYILKRILYLVKQHNTIDDKIKNNNQKDFTMEQQWELNTKDPLGRRRRRRKRGVLNFVGTVDKFLFGVMDNDDAKELHELAKTSNALNEQIKEVTDELINIAKFEEHKQCLERQRDDVCQYATAKMSLINEQLTQLDILYTNLDRAVDDALNNRINSLIMTPQRLYNEMTNVTMHVPTKMTWPVPLKKENMHDLINDKIVKTHVFKLERRKLVFILEVPLIDDQNYDVYQTIPIPLCDAINKCAVIVPDSRYLGVSTDKRNYVRLDDDTLRECKMTLKTLLCFKPNIVYVSSEAGMCDIKILLHYEVGQNECDVRVGKFDPEIFYRISDFNNWLYVLQRDTELTMDCANTPAAVDNIIHIAAGTGIVRGHNVTRKCNVGTKSKQLPLHQLKSSLFSYSAVALSTSFNLSNALGDLDKLQIKSMKNNADLDSIHMDGMTERLIDLRKRMYNNTVFHGAEVEGDAADGWFCWLVSFFNIKCTTAESVVACVVLALLALLLFRIYRFCCPGTCSALFSCCRFERLASRTRKTKSSVIRVNSQLQYLDRNSAADTHRKDRSFKEEEAMPMVMFKNNKNREPDLIFKNV